MAASIVPSDFADAMAGDDDGDHIPVEPLIVMSAESLSVVPFVDEIVAVKSQADPKALA